MTTYTTYGNGTSTITTGHTDPQGAGGVVFAKGTFDASLQTLTTADTVQLLTLPLGMIVEDVFLNIKTTDAGGGGVNIGDKTQAAGYGNYASLTTQGIQALAAGSATTYLYTNSTNAKVKGKLALTTADQAVMLAPTTASITTLKADVIVKGTIPA